MAAPLKFGASAAFMIISPLYQYPLEILIIPPYSRRLLWMTLPGMEGKEHVTAVLGYCKPEFEDNQEPGPIRGRRIYQDVPGQDARRCVVTDVRDRQNDFFLLDNGFHFFTHSVSLGDGEDIGMQARLATELAAKVTEVYVFYKA